MNRTTAENLLAQLIFDELDEPTKSELLAYLQTDPDLAARLHDMQQTVALIELGSKSAAPLTLDAHRQQKLLQAGRNRWNRPILFSFRHAAAAAAILLMILGLWGILLPAAGRARMSSSSIHKEKLALDTPTYPITDGLRESPDFDAPPSFDLRAEQSESDSVASGAMQEPLVRWETAARTPTTPVAAAKPASTPTPAEPGMRANTSLMPTTNDRVVALEDSERQREVTKSLETRNENIDSVIAGESGRISRILKDDLSNTDATYFTYTGGDSIFGQITSGVATGMTTTSGKQKTDFGGYSTFDDYAKKLPETNSFGRPTLGDMPIINGPMTALGGQNNPVFADAWDAAPKEFDGDRGAEYSKERASGANVGFADGSVNFGGILNEKSRQHPTGSISFGAGVRSDAGVLGAIDVNRSDTTTLNGITATEGIRIKPELALGLTDLSGSGDINGRDDFRDGRGARWLLESTGEGKAGGDRLDIPKGFAGDIQQREGQAKHEDQKAQSAPESKLQYGISPSKSAETEKSSLGDKQLATDELLRKARDLSRDGKYDAAQNAVDQVKSLDPQNETARSMEEVIIDQKRALDIQKLRAARGIEVARNNAEKLGQTTPSNDMITYPADWPDLTNRRGAGNKQADDTEATRVSREKLQQPIPVDFRENQFGNVIEYLRNVTGANIVVQWRAMEAAGISQDTPITMQLNNVAGDRVLHLLLDEVGGEKVKIGYTINNGVIVIAPSEILAAGKQAGSAEIQQAEQAALPPASQFVAVPVNPWVLTQNDHFSTFALDTDTASYTLARRYLQAGYRPPQASVRMEEFINAFDYHYPNQSQRTFAIHTDGATMSDEPSAWSGNTVLLKVGVKAKTLGREGRKPAHLIFVIDASGSMARADRLPMVQYALTRLVDQLDQRDHVTVIAYRTGAELLAEHEGLDQRDDIKRVINGIQPRASTNLLAGLQAAYQVAVRYYEAGQINRIIICSDGAANIGETDAQSILKHIDQYRVQGITLTTAGFGFGNFNDDMMSTLAKKGDGNYVFIDSKAQADETFVKNLSGTLQTVAKDAKIQVEFNPAVVRRYRLIGYERRNIADSDFRNDAVDAGEVGAGQSTTALYQLELIDNAATSRDDLGTVFVRYRDVDSGKVEEISSAIERTSIAKRTPGEDPRFYLAACAGQFAEILRGSPYADARNLEGVLRVVNEVAVALPLDRKVAELRDLIAASLDKPVAP